MSQEFQPRLHDILENKVGKKVKVIAYGLSSMRVRELKTGIEYGVAKCIYHLFKKV